MEEIEVPSHFLCPISLQLMRDPVTVSTGITYDRDSIEMWLYSCKNTTCPVTKQRLPDTELTPNHTLRRLIQGWCTLNASRGIERIPTPKPPVDRFQVMKILADARKYPDSRLDCLKRLRMIVSGSERNKKIVAVEELGVVEFLASIIRYYVHECSNSITEVAALAVDEALQILYNLDISEAGHKILMRNNGGIGNEFVDSLVHVLKSSGNYQSRAYAIIILRSAIDVADPIQLITMQTEFFREVVRVLSDQISQQASKAALKILVELCPWGRNRIKAVEGGAASVLIELLLDLNNKFSSDTKRFCELILTILDHLCGCAEGREELLKHGGGLAVVSKKILRVSHVASDRAVRILSSISRFSANSRVLQEMLQVGVVAKLCLVLQVECSLKTKERAREILRLHSRVWRSSPCIPAYLLSSYPSS